MPGTFSHLETRCRSPSFLSGTPWLQNAVSGRVSVNPEFPTGNGKVDLLLRSTKWGMDLVEIKSFTLPSYREQAARYAKKLGLSIATVVVFAPMNDASVLAKLSGDADVDGVHVMLIALGWV